VEKDFFKRLANDLIADYRTNGNKSLIRAERSDGYARLNRFRLGRSCFTALRWTTIMNMIIW